MLHFGKSNQNVTLIVNGKTIGGYRRAGGSRIVGRIVGTYLPESDNTG